MTLSTFYRGRPTRGSRLAPIGKVIWSGNRGIWDYVEHRLMPGTSEEPWRIQPLPPPFSDREEFVWVARRLHRIDRECR